MVLRLLECVRSTDHRHDTICDFIARANHEIRPKVFLDWPLGRRLAGTGVHIRTVGKADPACDDLFNETPSVRLADRIWADRAAWRAFYFSFQSKAPALNDERCAPRDEGAVHAGVDDDLHDHEMTSV